MTPVSLCTFVDEDVGGGGGGNCVPTGDGGGVEPPPPEQAATTALNEIDPMQAAVLKRLRIVDLFGTLVPLVTVLPLTFGTVIFVEMASEKPEMHPLLLTRPPIRS